MRMRSIDFKLLKNFGYGLACAAFFCAVFFSIADAEEPELVDRIVAVVNDDIISLSELNEIFKPYAERVSSQELPIEEEREMLFKVREEILGQLINQKLTDQETKRLGITVSDKEIDSAIERIKEANLYTDGDLREEILQKGTTMAEYRKHLKEQILRSRLVNFEVKSKIVITREEIASYYEAHKDEYRGDKKYHLQHIMLKVSDVGDDSEKPEIQKKAGAIWEKLKQGEPFEKMAEKYSQAPSASDGGDLGTFKAEDLSPQLQKALKGLKAGEFTPVLDTGEMGYQIFLVREIINSQAKSLEGAIPDIEEKLFKEIVNEKFQSWLEELRQRSHIKIIR
ncbi:SurA N-terminal domain-containing protein [Desulfococcaceae bacterium HSG8]|nr:SurA N-terminal domain-containing protein [Desulfococcaceae bacterium HSG8]